MRIAHGCNALNGWLSSGGCFDVDFWESLRERVFLPVLGMGLDDVRGTRRPGRVEAQASRADFELANSRSFLAQMVAQGATMNTRFMCEAFAYAASEKDSEIHDLSLSFGFKRCRRVFDATVCSSS